MKESGSTVPGEDRDRSGRRKFLKKMIYTPPAIATLLLDHKARAQGNTEPPPPPGPPPGRSGPDRL